MNIKYLSIVFISICLLLASTVYADTWELRYDNGFEYIPNFHTNPGNGWAVKFENNPDPTGYILRAKIYIGNPPGNENFEGCYIQVRDVQGGEPGDIQWESDIRYPAEVGWNEFPINIYWTYGNFVLVFIQVGYYPQCDGVYNDTGSGNLHSYEYRNDIFYTFTDYNLMIRAIWSDQPPAIQSMSVGKIKSLFE